jgi:hypothetical protein
LIAGIDASSISSASRTVFGALALNLVIVVSVLLYKFLYSDVSRLPLDDAFLVLVIVGSIQILVAFLGIVLIDGALWLTARTLEASGAGAGDLPFSALRIH